MRNDVMDRVREQFVVKPASGGFTAGVPIHRMPGALWLGSMRWADGDREQAAELLGVPVPTWIDVLLLQDEYSGEMECTVVAGSIQNAAFSEESLKIVAIDLAYTFLRYWWPVVNDVIYAWIGAYRVPVHISAEGEVYVIE